ncbi:MAG: GNAT family N-acetyltransferase [Alphaproteobacteria bacterium]|jgi:[ribosomal protein S5]-alanine N-acetyltransferase|nr:GNAT family N-acetyltransferase [Alphaproteobacteria bacterium]MBT5390672.1 GNAT family N-acetyltransferase [Alphaproteobacteria bacterium]MBT5540260.1 GNAT family N-acetyltransferase [Alphaproteobacteria bacterium]MBT5654056.1 GNAT family N-acetyltransferase [Alphaproteobacteria bacterium]
MREALKPITAYAFGDLGFEKLILTNAVENKRSSKLKAKTGARLIRTDPAQFVDSQFKTREVWELTKKDWETFLKHDQT